MNRKRTDKKGFPKMGIGRKRSKKRKKKEILKEQKDIEKMLVEDFETTGQKVAEVALEFVRCYQKGARGKQLIQVVQLNEGLCQDALRYFLYIGLNEFVRAIK